MRCEVYGRQSNDNGYCMDASYVEIDSNGMCTQSDIQPKADQESETKDELSPNWKLLYTLTSIEEVGTGTGKNYVAGEQSAIDPESLPIVQQLRAETEKLNNEILKYRDELNRANTALDSAAKWYLFHAE